MSLISAANKFKEKYKHLKFTEEMVIQGLKDADVEMRIEAANCFRGLGQWQITCSLETINTALLDADERVRMKACELNIKYTQEQIARGLTDTCAVVRGCFIRNNNHTPTSTQIELFTIDNDAIAREAIFCRGFHWCDINFSASQIERGLTDACSKVRIATSKQKIKFTPEQVERGLLDPSPAVREAFARNLFFTPSAEQLDRGLNDFRDIATAFIWREDITLTDSQTANIFHKNHIYSIFSLALRKDFLPTAEQENIIIQQDCYSVPDYEAHVSERIPVWKHIREKTALTSKFGTPFAEAPQSKKQCL